MALFTYQGKSAIVSTIITYAENYMTTGETQQPGGVDSEQAWLNAYSPPEDFGEQAIRNHQNKAITGVALSILIDTYDKYIKALTPESWQHAQSEEFTGYSPEEREEAITRIQQDARRVQPWQQEAADQDYATLILDELTYNHKRTNWGKNEQRELRAFLDEEFSA